MFGFCDKKYTDVARKIWITPDYTYCYRILDKRIKFSSSKVIYNIAQGDFRYDENVKE